MKTRWWIGLAALGTIAGLGVTVSILGNRAAAQRSLELERESLLAETRHGAIEYVSGGRV